MFKNKPSGVIPMYFFFKFSQEILIYNRGLEPLFYLAILSLVLAMWSLLLAAFFNENPVLIHHRQRWIRKQHLVCLRSFLGERGQCHYVEVERKEREGRSLALPLPFLDLLFWVCCGVRDLRKVLKHLNVEASPAEPSCELAVNAVCYETQAPKCQCICNTFQGRVRRPGAVDEFFIFLYIYFAHWEIWGV